MKRSIAVLLLVAGASVAIGVAWKPVRPAASPDASAHAEASPGQSEPSEQAVDPVAGLSILPSADAPAITADETAASSQDRNRQIALEIESALLSMDAGRRETAFGVLLPELLSSESARVVELIARQPAGAPRDALREEVARLWITRDTEPAVAWLQSLGEERAAGARVAVRALAAVSPAQAIDVADRLGVGHDDGSVEHILQIWAAESPHEARRWLENQPESARVSQRRARLPP